MMNKAETLKYSIDVLKEDAMPEIEHMITVITTEYVGANLIVRGPPMCRERVQFEERIKNEVYTFICRMLEIQVDACDLAQPLCDKLDPIVKLPFETCKKKLEKLKDLRKEGK